MGCAVPLVPLGFVSLRGTNAKTGAFFNGGGLGGALHIDSPEQQADSHDAAESDEFFLEDEDEKTSSADISPEEKNTKPSNAQ